MKPDFILDENVYIDQVLVEWASIPLFFICKGKVDYYVALLTDVDEYDYYVFKVSMGEISKMFHQKLTMRDLLLNQSEYWEVTTGESVETDQAIKLPIELINHDLLPDVGANFEILTNEIDTYAKQFDCKMAGRVINEFLKTVEGEKR